MEYEVRYTPDGLPLGIFDTLAQAHRFAAKRAAMRGMGPYLIYEVGYSGERYIGESA